MILGESYSGLDMVNFIVLLYLSRVINKKRGLERKMRGKKNAIWEGIEGGKERGNCKDKNAYIVH